MPEARVVTTEWGHKVQKAGARRPSRVRAHNAKGGGTGWGYAMQKHAKRNAKHAGGPKDGHTHCQKHAGMVAQVRTENAENRGTVSKAGGYSVPNAGGTVENKDWGTQWGHTVRYTGAGVMVTKDVNTQCQKTRGHVVSERKRAHNANDRRNNVKARATRTWAQDVGKK